MEKKLFGTMPDGTPVYECTMQNNNFSVSVITYGGIIRRFVSYGTDIICGFDTLPYYLEDCSHQGALIGRYANRIDRGQFTLNGKDYQLRCNNCGDTVHLHGGPVGFSRRVWELINYDNTHVSLQLFSPDGEENYPGNLTVNVTYTLREDGLSLSYTATTDADTPISLTNHAYFNLDGCGSGDIFDTIVTIYADEYSELNERMIPVRHLPVAGTVFDFNTPHTIGARMEGFEGYDHNYILRTAGNVSLPACTAENGKLRLTMFTDCPCVQFYIANALEGDHPFKGGSMPTKHTAFCLEAQTEPNGPRRGEAILHAGETYHQLTIYKIERV